MKVNTDDLKLAEVRYYDVEHNGLEYTKPLAYVVLLNRGDTYVSLLNPGDIAPIYERVPYTSNAVGTEDYIGTKIRQVFGDVISGEAWLLTDFDFTTKFDRKDVEIKDVEDFVLGSELFFKDRISLAQDRAKKSITQRFLMSKVIVKDQEPMREMLEFFAERDSKKVYQK